ncbi:MAG: hypothetical protein Q8L90_10740 [Bacteroidota bacterium]|nr:hypothetical protein [Bacteroidota bacterium]
MKNLKRRNSTYKLNELPELTSYSFVYGKLIGYTGSIFRRRLDGPIKGKIYWHYAFFYGFGKDDTLYLIENNQDGVEVITWTDFILALNYWEPRHIEENLDRYSEIMGRAKEKAKEIYEGGENNCEHFVNYSVFGKHESEQSENTKKVAELFILALEARIMLSPEPKDHKYFDFTDDLRNLTKIKRDDRLTEIIERRKNPQRNNIENNGITTI